MSHRGRLRGRDGEEPAEQIPKNRPAEEIRPIYGGLAVHRRSPDNLRA